MPEGDSLHRAARRLQVLVGERVEVETPHPRAAVKGLAERLDGRRLERVEAVGKNLLLRFEGGLVLRSHLRMNGRWRVERRGAERAGEAVARAARRRARGRALERRRARARRRARRAAARPGHPRRAARLRDDARAAALGSAEREVGDALLDQRLVAGIGNLWKAEALWEARVSPWRRLEEVDDDELRAVLEAAHTLMRTALDGPRPPRRVYRRAGRACPRCGGVVRSAPQGENARTAYWCPGCQVGGNAPPS